MARRCARCATDDGFYPKAGEGYFACRGCEKPLYSAEAKFKSGCGWPAFDSHAMCECDAPTHRVSSDEGEHVEARLSAYATHTQPLLEHLRGRGTPFHEVEVVADLAQMDEQVAAVVSRS